MSPRPGRIVRDETVPFRPTRDAALRATPAFVAFRERVAAAIGTG